MILTITVECSEQAIPGAAPLTMRCRSALRARPLALTIGHDFIASKPIALALSDNLFFGNNLSGLLVRGLPRKSGGTVLSYHVDDPSRYALCRLNMNAIRLHVPVCLHVYM